MVERAVVLVLILIILQDASHTDLAREAELADSQSPGHAATAEDIRGLVREATTDGDLQDTKEMSIMVTIEVVADLRCQAGVAILVTGNIQGPVDALVCLA